VCGVRFGFDKNSGSQVALAKVQDRLRLWVALGAAVSPLSLSLPTTLLLLLQYTTRFTNR
jgi:hypothetical protein